MTDMTKQTEATSTFRALKLALEGAANYIDALGGDSRKYRQALASEAIEQPAQQQSAERGEPVGMWMGDCIEWTENPYKFRKGQPLYTSPPAQEFVCSTGLCHYRKPLTDEEISDLWDGHVVPVFGKNGINPIVFARAIEAAHGIKENT